jgi:hypothetical protein
MSVSTYAFWKGMTQDDYHNQPSFGDGGFSWGHWVAGMFGRPDLLKLAKRLEVSALLSHTTHGMWWYQIRWKKPQEIVAAAERLQGFIEHRDQDALKFLEIYKEHSLGEKPAEQEFVDELRDIMRIATFLEGRGIKKMTFEISF